MSQPNVTTAGKLVVIADNEYTLSPPTWHDWEWLQTEMRAEFIASCRAEFPDGLPDADEQRIRSQAFAMEMLGGEGSRWLSSSAGVTRLVYAMLKSKHPEVKLADVYRWLIFENNFALKRDAMEVTSASLPSPAAGGAPKKTPVSPSTGETSTPPSSSNSESPPATSSE